MMEALSSSETSVLTRATRRNILEVVETPNLTNKLVFRMFDISETGDVILVDMTLLNGSTVHMAAVATDSGIPPRQVQ
jgi:hypothetical protein